jgi:outer membrane protein assembly factor BamB
MMMKLQIVTLTIVLFLFAMVIPFESPVSAMSKPAPEPVVKKTEGWLVPRGLVEMTDLKIVWQFNQPLGEGESLDKMFIFGNRLCTLSSQNFLSCLNRADGNVIFSGSIAAPGLPVTGMEYFKNELITIVGSSLVEISMETGDQKASMTIATGTTCPVVRNDDFFYIAGLDRRLHALHVENKVLAFEAAAENDSLITSVLAEGDVVVFGTNKGNVICIAADKAFKLWQFDAPAAIVPPIVRDGDSLYFACRDTNIYRLDLSSGKLVWKYQTQAIVESEPQVGAKVIYQQVPDVGLVAVNKESGKQIWQVDNGAGLLAESGDKAFVITKAGVIVAMDNVKAKQLYTINIGKPVKYAVNALDSKIYIADTEGRLACLEPVR